ncbi:unnamed protein product [Dibothriocephalus latus]|uniref:Uncharacterized protein n=1 Tax=Dibothriocephalus latus TaxID=60516 RepID=A0A3P7NN82_DIBLA|nr:unnamed protein product [Dibothriocephalus latus]
MSFLLSLLPQPENLPASLHELYRLIDLAKFSVSRQHGKRLEKQSKLHTFLPEVLKTCRAAFCTQPPTKPPPASTSLWVLVHQLAMLSQPSQLDPAQPPAFLKMAPFLSSYSVVDSKPYALSGTLNALHRDLLDFCSSFLDFAEFFGLGTDDLRTKCATYKATIKPSAPFDRFCQAVDNFKVKYLRHQGPAVNFFNGGLSESHRTSLGYLLRATFQAHARLAPVSRGCPPACQKSGDETGRRAHAECWPQRRDDPDWWWWYSYFSPAVSDATYTGEVILLLLLPGLPAQSAASTPESAEHAEFSTEGADYLLSVGPSFPTSSMKANVGTGGRVKAPPPPLRSLAACDEGFPRLPIGDSHEAFLLRICYLALLVQALLSWQGNEQQGLDATRKNSDEQPQESVYSETDPHVSAWLTSGASPLFRPPPFKALIAYFRGLWLFYTIAYFQNLKNAFCRF